jgi:hypothetical protein
MANNRLYIGNKKTLDYIGIAKSFTIPWDSTLVLSEFLELLETDITGPPGRPTDLVIFSEYDKAWDRFTEKGNLINHRPKPRTTNSETSGEPRPV